MTAYTMNTKDPRLVASAISDVERIVLERAFDELIQGRIRYGYSLKLPDITRPALIRAWECLLLDILDAIDAGAVLNFKTPRVIPKLPCLVAQLYSEKYGRCREALFTDLTAKFEVYIA